MPVDIIDIFLGFRTYFFYRLKAHNNIWFCNIRAISVY